jgi:hypothetical protein
MKNYYSFPRLLLLSGLLIVISACEKADLSIQPETNKIFSHLNQEVQVQNSFQLNEEHTNASYYPKNARSIYDMKIDHAIYTKANYYVPKRLDFNLESGRRHQYLKNASKYLEIKGSGQGWSEIFGRNLLDLNLTYNMVMQRCSGTIQISFPFDPSVISLVLEGDSEIISDIGKDGVRKGLVVSLVKQEATGIFKECKISAKAHFVDLDQIIHLTQHEVETGLKIIGTIEFPD